MNTGNAKMDARSEGRLQGCHPKIVRLIREFAKVSKQQFIVTEGLRTPERQAELVKAGASRTMNSKHLVGRAVDLAVVLDGEIRWDWPLYAKVAVDVKETAAKLGIKIVWGGDWPKFRDGPHYELAAGE